MDGNAEDVLVWFQLVAAKYTLNVRCLATVEDETSRLVRKCIPRLEVSAPLMGEKMIGYCKYS